VVAAVEPKHRQAVDLVRDQMGAGGVDGLAQIVVLRRLTGPGGDVPRGVGRDSRVRAHPEGKATRWDRRIGRDGVGTRSETGYDERNNSKSHSPGRAGWKHRSSLGIPEAVSRWLVTPSGSLTPLTHQVRASTHSTQQRVGSPHGDAFFRYARKVHRIHHGS